MEFTDQIAKKAFVGGIVSLLLSPAYVLLGSWLNRYLAAPELRVEYVTPVVIVKNAKLDWTAVADLRKQVGVAATLRDLLFRVGIARSRRPCVEWLDQDEWINDCAEDVKLALQYHSAMVDARLSELESWVNAVKGGKTPLPVSFVALDQYFMRMVTDKASAQSGIAAYLETTRGEKATLESFIKRFNATVGVEGERTGSILLRLGVLNSGDSDGVIARGGVLKFADSEVLVRARRYTVVKAHSLEEGPDRVDPLRNGPTRSFTASATSPVTCLTPWRHALEKDRHREGEDEVRAGVGASVREEPRHGQPERALPCVRHQPTDGLHVAEPVSERRS